MTNHVSRSNNESKREGLSWDERWKASDNGLVACWEQGREKSIEAPVLAERARRGELPVLCWKGGVGKNLEKKKKYGSLKYLAYWQGLRGEDLDIHIDEEKELICAKTGITVIFTADSSKYAEP